MKTIVLLTISNVFMTFTWYGHLKFKEFAALDRDSCQLVDRVYRVLFSGACEPRRLVPIFDGPVEDHCSVSWFALYSSCFMSDEIRLTHIQSGPELEEIRALFLEYARGLDFNLCFQNFDHEMERLPGDYGLPQGRLILCQINGKSAGCVALKPLGTAVCEMKRLFVRPDFRGRQLGLKLVQRIVNEARVMGYSVMRLDTIQGKMDNAIALYQSIGFKEIPPYYSNPIPNAFYMELKL